LINRGQAGGRSETGGLLAWNGDEAAAAALYLFLRHSATGDTWKALQEAVWAVGDSDTIATLVGALMGARYGFTLTGENAQQLPQLENFEMIKKIAAELGQ
jgi:ADP-ribosylglycohydrolase